MVTESLGRKLKLRTGNRRRLYKSEAFLSFLLLVLPFCFAGCSPKTQIDPEEKAICSREGVINCFMTEEGAYFYDENYMLRYFDIKSGTTVFVCDKAECEHKSAEISGKETCNAQISADQIAVYHDKIYYLTAGDQYNTQQLRCRDLDGNNDRQVAQFLGILISTDTSTWFYRDRLVVITEISFGKTFNAETGEAENSTIRLNCINLNSGECDVIQDSSSLSGFGYSIYKAENGKIFYYSIEKERFFEYDLETKILTELDVPCTAKIGMKEEKNGISRSYHFAYGDYCYGVGGEVFDCDRILKANINTGEEEAIYSNTEVYYVTYRDFVLIIDYSKGGIENYEQREFYLYDTEKQELMKLQNSFLSEPGMGEFGSISKEGILFSWAVNIEPGQKVYTGDFEYRYMTMEDLLDGKDNYVSVYYLKQE